MKKRNKFSLSYYNLSTLRFGYIYPIGLLEVLPGDTIRMASSAFIRVAPMLAPVMHPVHVTIHHWYVPFRLIWDDFEDFITGGPDGLNVSEPPWDYINYKRSYPHTMQLPDYLGIPPLPETDNIGGKARLSILPFRAYNLIFNEWYRDQDLVDPIEFPTTSGRDLTTPRLLRLAAWERDVFTTARPWPQKGMQVTVPVNPPTNGPSVSQVTLSGSPNISLSPLSNNYEWKDNQSGNAGSYWGTNADAAGANSMAKNAGLQVNWDQGTFNVSGGTYDPGTGGIGNVDINQLREAFALQRFEEARAMYGSRYVEYLRYLGIKASDARLQRPEYLGGGRQTIQFSEVLQTDPSDTTPAGNMTGHGIGAMRTNRFRRFIEEHGLILSFMMIRPKSIYSNGVDRFYLKETKEDFFQKELEHIGQQEVWSAELFRPYGINSAPVSGHNTFGYQNRYDEYRSHWSRISGEFRDIFNYWHLARDFSETPTLNGDFITCNPSPRIFAAQENDHFYCMINHSIQARRLLSKFGNPL